MDSSDSYGRLCSDEVRNMLYDVVTLPKRQTARVEFVLLCIGR